MKSKIFRLCGVILAMFILIGCHPPIPVITVLWEPDGNGFIQLSTNDYNYYNSLFTKTYPSSLETPMTTVTVETKKISGSQAAGYGIVFCSADSDNYYRIAIFPDATYSVDKKVAGSFTTIKVRTYTSYLNAGLDALNEISVTQTTPNNFEIFMNGTSVATFNDTSFTGGEAGFAVYVGAEAYEHFPSDPVDVRFKMTSPVAVP